MAQSFDLHEQAAHCGRHARDCTGIGLRDRLPGFAEQYTARAVLEASGEVIRTAGPEDRSPG